MTSSREDNWQDKGTSGANQISAGPVWSAPEPPV